MKENYYFYRYPPKNKIKNTYTIHNTQTIQYNTIQYTPADTHMGKGENSYIREVSINLIFIYFISNSKEGK
jgi:hypothetical protein